MTVLSRLLIYFMAQHVPYSIFLLLPQHIAISSLLYPSESRRAQHMSSLERDHLFLEHAPSKPYQCDSPLSYYSHLRLYFSKSSGLVTRSRPLFSNYIQFYSWPSVKFDRCFPHPLFWVRRFLFPLSHNDSLLSFLFFMVSNIFIVMLSSRDRPAFLFCLGPGKTDLPGKSACSCSHVYI